MKEKCVIVLAGALAGLCLASCGIDFKNSKTGESVRTDGDAIKMESVSEKENEGTKGANEETISKESESADGAKEEDKDASLDQTNYLPELEIMAGEEKKQDSSAETKDKDEIGRTRDNMEQSDGAVSSSDEDTTQSTASDETSEVSDASEGQAEAIPTEEQKDNTLPDVVIP